MESRMSTRHGSCCLKLAGSSMMILVQDSSCVFATWLHHTSLSFRFMISLLRYTPMLMKRHTSKASRGFTKRTSTDTKGNERERGASAFSEVHCARFGTCKEPSTKEARAITEPSTRSRFLDATRRRSVVCRSASRRDKAKRAPSTTSHRGPARPPLRKTRTRASRVNSSSVRSSGSRATPYAFSISVQRCKPSMLPSPSCVSDPSTRSTLATLAAIF
mmetsp:Transcript_21486/g.60590  ORF Transcript_21486/g.60590 Transcript_21486/m.60590 type:complete len:218 (-) Transcript_21486:1577-2230(-)